MLIQEELDEALLGAVTLRFEVSHLIFFNTSTAVEEDTLAEELSISKRLQLKRVNIIVLEDLVHGPESTHSHLVLSKGTGLVCTDLVGTSHSLGGIKLSDKVVLLLHLHN